MNIGDTVKIVLNRYSDEGKDKLRGKTANITKIVCRDFEISYRILLDISNDWWFCEDELEICPNFIDIEI